MNFLKGKIEMVLLMKKLCSGHGKRGGRHVGMAEGVSQ
jgi:hypothetical protein